MSIAGYPMDHGDQGPHDDGRATPAGGPPEDWDKKFTAIVSGITGDIRWSATPDELDDAAATAASKATSIPRAPDSIWEDAEPDSADDRKLRRELRRAERAAALAAFQEAQAEADAALAADTEHFVPPEPPPLPRLKRRTTGAIALLALGLLLVLFPRILPAATEFVIIVGILLLMGGGAILLMGLRKHHDDGWDDGARV